MRSGDELERKYVERSRMFVEERSLVRWRKGSTREINDNGRWIDHPIIYGIITSFEERLLPYKKKKKKQENLPPTQCLFFLMEEIYN